MNTIVDKEDQLVDAHISVVRALAKSYGIKAQRDWNKDDFIAAITKAQEAGASLDVATDKEQEEADRLIANYSLPAQRVASAAQGKPKPGYARIILHKDPTPGHANSPVQVALNGRFFSVPRGIAVDIPIPYLGVLRDASNTVRRQIEEPSRDKTDGVWSEEEILSYPYQIIAITPGGKFTNTEDQRGNSAKRRKAFHNEFQRWPTDGELIEWEKSLVRNAK